MDVTTDVDSEIQLFGLSSYYAAVATIMVIPSQTMAVAMITAVYGLSFFSSSVAVAAVAVTDSANKTISDGSYSVALFFSAVPLVFCL